MVKVDANKGRDQAAREGSEHHWQGNNAADEVAKLVHPKLVGKEDRQKQFVGGLKGYGRTCSSLRNLHTGGRDPPPRSGTAHGRLPRWGVDVFGAWDVLQEKKA